MFVWLKKAYLNKIDGVRASHADHQTLCGCLMIDFSQLQGFSEQAGKVHRAANAEMMTFSLSIKIRTQFLFPAIHGTSTKDKFPKTKKCIKQNQHKIPLNKLHRNM